MDDQQTPARAADARGVDRTNLFISAILSSGDSTCPTRIRNLSKTGAMVETSAVPASGSNVTLIRGSRSARGTTVWASPNRCGILFDSPVRVSEWIAPPANQEQLRVDSNIALLRAGALPISPESPNKPRPAGHLWIAEEIGELSRLLERLGSELSNDPYVVEKFGNQLQCIDIVTQALGLLEAGLKGGDSGDGQFASRLQSLKASRAQALKTML